MAIVLANGPMTIGIVTAPVEGGCVGVFTTDLLLLALRLVQDLDGENVEVRRGLNGTLLLRPTGAFEGAGWVCVAPRTDAETGTPFGGA